MEHQKNFKKTARPLFRPKTNHIPVCHQKPNPSRETVPLRGHATTRAILTKRLSDEHARLPIRGICAADLSNTGVHDKDHVVWFHGVAHSQHLLKQGLLLFVPALKITAQLGGDNLKKV